MKKFIPFIVAGMFGGLMTWGIIQISQPELETTHQDLHLTSYGESSKNTGVNNLPFDFADAADIASPSVVLIRANISETLANQKRQQSREDNPFGRFFDLFGDSDMDLMMPFSWNMIPPPGTGSGVIISSDGFVVTNNHVVENYDEINITLNNGEVYPAKIVGKDPGSDLAVLKINANNLPTLEVANSDEVRVGEWVLAIGNPYEELRSTVTAGIVSAKGRDINILKGEKKIEEFIQTDAAINPGNSGGALVNSAGELVGINTAIYSRTGSYVGYSFAIPSNLMAEIVSDLIKNWNPERTSLGVNVLPLDEEIVRELELPVEKGLLIRKVIDRSSAQYAGLLPDDIIVEVDDKKISEFDDLKVIMDKAKIGDKLNIKVMRGEELIDVDVRLKDGL